MATTFAPIINITNVSKGMKSLNSGLGNLKKSSDTIKTVTLNKTRIKRESFARDKVLSNMREEAIRRRDQENIIEASSIGGAMKRTTSIIGDSTKGFLERILDFSSSLLLGWLLYNLPTIMTGIEDLIIRINSLFGVLTDFMKNMQETLVNFGDLLSGVYYDISHFDFTDDSKIVQSAMDDLNVNLETMHDQFLQGFNILNKPLGEGPGEEPVPELNTDYTQPGPTTDDGQQSPSSSREVGGVHKQALDIIAKYESESSGGYNAMNQGGEGSRGIYGSGDSQSPRLLGKKLTDMTVSEIMRRQAENNRYSGPNKVGIFAAGRYQIIPDTLKGIVKSGAIKPSDKFDEKTQDKAGLQLIKESGIQPWAFDAESRSRFSSKELNIVEKARKTPVSIIQSTQPAPPKSTQPSSPIPTAQVKSKPMVITSGFGWRWGGQHKGIDLVTKTGKVEGTPVVIKKGGTIVYANIGGGNMGQVLITHDDGTQSRYLHVNSFQVRAGQKVNAGQTIANLAAMGASGIGNATGPHLHFEYYSSTRAGPSDPAGVYKNYVSLGGGGVPTSNPLDPNQQSRTASAQVTPPKPPGQNVPSVAQDKKGPTVLIADNPSSPPTPQQVPSSNESQLQMIPFEDSLNSLIKNQILLELAYT
jgi:murein DD-endopeptidase MepM/ murein hydrolase activator NlpD